MRGRPALRGADNVAKWRLSIGMIFCETRDVICPCTGWPGDRRSRACCALTRSLASARDIAIVCLEAYRLSACQRQSCGLAKWRRWPRGPYERWLKQYECFLKASSHLAEGKMRPTAGDFIFIWPSAFVKRITRERKSTALALADLASSTLQ